MLEDDLQCVYALQCLTDKEDKMTAGNLACFDVLLLQTPKSDLISLPVFFFSQLPHHFDSFTVLGKV